MKKIFFALLLAFSIIFMASCDLLPSPSRRKLSKEETMFTMGRYPQTLVTDTNTYIEVLNKIEKNNLTWNPLETYTMSIDNQLVFDARASEDEFDLKADADYIDLDENNDDIYDYRIVKINQVRTFTLNYLGDPVAIKNAPKIDSPYEGYYLFNWEPVKWNIFRKEGEIDNKKEAYAACDVVLDTCFFDLKGEEDYAKSDLRVLVNCYFAKKIFSIDELNSLKGESVDQIAQKILTNGDTSSFKNDSVQIATSEDFQTSSEDGSIYYKNKFSTTFTDYAKVMGYHDNRIWKNIDKPEYEKKAYAYNGSASKEQSQLYLYYGLDFYIIVDYDKYRPEGY